ncbi:MAG: murein biosynthesis integral membrane protein MurJ [Candidatus Lloydbacteria bacterium RIFCSPHIGHO2_01_FULL_41_20]|uniref:Probable lipid II flippase MurJ n=1 Tax=Candidatus Lloydbacteria bacterium RIFCSPHIGHO2_01_FULL_41_20 TaxID=1798657 RepID=A0A1G2CSW7_9BACT|nr:MAG: murein biosynthesis integral membrane protein MurJ [Candidatus Lloydbacteria bacterium RIFCSPHIGHO2_01_FULL_41_20]
MGSRIVAFLGKEWHNLNDAALLLSSFAILSQVLAIVRDRLFAHFFGASATLDVYYTAFRIPDFLYVSLASFVSVTVLIPLLIEKMGDSREGNEESRKFIDDVFTIFFAVMIVVSIVLFFLIPVIVPFIAPGFDEVAMDELILLSRILLLSPILIGISNLVGSVTQTLRKFFVYALSPVFYNIGIIIGILFLYPLFGISGLAYGVVLGAIFHFAIQIPILLSHKFLPSFSLDINWKAIKKIIFISLPRTITLSLNQFSLIVIIAIASLLEEGSVSVFNFSYNLQSVPIVIIGISYSVAAFPSMVRFFSIGDRIGFAREIESAARTIIFWSLPITFLFIVLRAQIVRVLLGSGEFSWTDTRLTAAMLAVFAMSLLAQNLLPLFVRGYYAAGDTKRPLYVNLFSYGLIIVLSFGLVSLIRKAPEFRYFIENLLRVADVPGTEVLALPLAYSIGTLANIFLLFRIFEKDFAKGLYGSLSRTFFQSFSASFLMGFTAYQFLGVFDKIFDINTFWGIFAQGFFSGIIGLIVGTILLKLLGSHELTEIHSSLKHKFWKTRAIAPEQEIL